MPLKSTDKPACYEAGVIRFTMTNGRHLVSCYVTAAALDALCGMPQKTQAERMIIFNRHRGRIEAIARILFDRGEPCPLVCATRVAPRSSP